MIAFVLMQHRTPAAKRALAPSLLMHSHASVKKYGFFYPLRGIRYTSTQETSISSQRLTSLASSSIITGCNTSPMLPSSASLINPKLSKPWMWYSGNNADHSRRFSSSNDPTDDSPTTTSSPIATNPTNHPVSIETTVTTPPPNSLNKRAHSPVVPKDTSVLASAEEAIRNAHRSRGLQLYAGGPIDRYLPPKDPSLFLIEAEKLTIEERRFQIVFAVFPWVFFGLMIAFPFFLLLFFIPYLAEKQKWRAEDAFSVMFDTFRVAAYRPVTYNEMLDILERPYPTLVFYYHPSKMLSKILLPFLYDFYGLLSQETLPISLVSFDLSDPQLPASLRETLPIASSPHLQLILPYALNGDSAYIPFDGEWSSEGLLNFLASQFLIHKDLYQKAQVLDRKLEELTDLVFSLLFVDECPPSLPEDVSITSLLQTEMDGRIMATQTMDMAIDSCHTIREDVQGKCVLNSVV